MSSFIRNALSLSASAAALVLVASAANASSFAVRSGQGAEGLGMAYAGAGSGGIGLAGMAWNPAVITMFPGRNSNWNATYLKANASYDITRAGTIAGFPMGIAAPGAASGPSGGIGLDGAFIPATFNSWQITDRIFLGLTNTAPFGLRSKPENQNYIGQTYGRSATIRTVNIAPTIGVKVTDWLSFGAALQIQYGQADLKQAAAVQAGSPSVQLRGDSIDYGYRLGMTITPWQGGTIGLSYRSAIDQRIKGQFRSPTGAIVPVALTLPLPDSWVLSLSQEINSQWSVHASVEYTRWSRFNNLFVKNRNTGGPLFTAAGRPPLSLNFQYDDSWYFAGGVEYKMNSALTLRAGVGYELSAVNSRNRTVFISDNDRWWLSTGFTYAVSNQLSLDVGYTFIKVNKATINYDANHPQNAGLNATQYVNFAAEAKPTVHSVSVGLTYRWDTPSVAQAAPGVRK
jgi:long-chain fatty acid transport protein